jgi:hypothetical protein
LRDHHDVAFNPTFIFDRSKLSLIVQYFFWGVLRHAVDLLAQREEARRENPNNPHIEVMLQYHKNI